MPVDQIALPDGRVLDYCLNGDDGAPLVVLHLGTPGGVTEFPEIADAVTRAGLRLAICSRPGYGGSTRRLRHTVADTASDTAQLADALGAHQFFVAGWSGGGPSALACAALLPARVRACVTLAGIAPLAEAVGVWQDWYSPDDREEMQALITGATAGLVPEYETAALAVASMTAAALREDPRMAPADRAAFREVPGAADSLARSLRRGVSSGIWGWLDDSVAHATDWGFSLSDIRVPVVIRHGDDDRLVSIAQGRWLAEHIPGAVLDEVPGAGHGSVGSPFAPVVTALLAADTLG